MISFIFANFLNLLGLGGLVVMLFLVFFTDPFESSKITIYLFYLSLFVGIFGIYSLFEFNIRKRFFKLHSDASHLRESILNALLLASTVSLLLFLQMIRVLRAWDAILLILCIFLLKLYLSVRKSKYQ